MPLRSSIQFQQIDQRKAELIKLKSQIPDAEAILENYFYGEDSLNALIEGLGLTFEDRQSVSHQIPSEKGTRFTEKKNLKLTLDFIIQTAKSSRPQTLEVIVLKTHGLLLADIDPRAGTYRTEEGEHLFASHRPPPASFVERAIQNSDWFTADSFNEIHPVEQAALIVARLLEIQPFSAGNLAVTHLTASLFLISTHFPFPLIRREDWPGFCRAVELAFNLVMQDLIDFYTRAVGRSLDEALRRVQGPGSRTSKL